MEFRKIEVVLGVNEAGLQELNDVFLRFCTKPFEHIWPARVVTCISWLCKDDAVAAKRLMIAIDAERSASIVKIARAESDRLVMSLKNLDAAVEGTHSIELPYGRITLRVRKPTIFEKITNLFS